MNKLGVIINISEKSLLEIKDKDLLKEYSIESGDIICTSMK